MDSRFGDRFDGTTYEHDPVVDIFHDSDLRPKELWLPEGCFTGSPTWQRPTPFTYSLCSAPNTNDFSITCKPTFCLTNSCSFAESPMTLCSQGTLSAFVDLVVIACRDHSHRGAAIRVEME